jgi:DNA-binding cell septation regulator SpoVG
MSKICAIHQPNFIPWQGFFYKIAHCDVFILLDTVNIELGSAKSITHRTRIKTNNGVLWLAIPIKKGDSKLIKDILIDNSRNWREPMLKNIYQQYKKATNFDQIYTFFEPLINNSSDFLSDYNTNIIINTAQLLTIKTPIIKASDIDILSNDRNLRLIELCKSQQANCYLSGRGGKNYHNEELFKSENINIKYMDYTPSEYLQLHGEFVSGLGVLDYLFNNDYLI